MVLFNRYASDAHIHVVRCDNVEGGRLVADAFIDSGCQRIAFIAGEEASSTNRDRENGFVARLCKERGYPLAYRESAGDYRYEAGYQAAERLLRKSDRPDAIFCANDLIAMGVMDLARLFPGFASAGRLSVIGFDDIPSAAWPGYNLTTIQQPAEALVEITVNVLLNAIQNSHKDTVEDVILPVLIHRGSSR